MTFDLDAWEKKYLEDQAKEQARLQASKSVMLADLAMCSVAVAVVEYDGSGDDGSLTGTSFFGTVDEYAKFRDPTRGRGAETVELSDEVREMIEDYAWDLLEAYYSGWENNEGATGEIIFDVNEGTVTIHHGVRVESIEYEDDTI